MNTIIDNLFTSLNKTVHNHIEELVLHFNDTNQKIINENTKLSEINKILEHSNEKLLKQHGELLNSNKIFEESNNHLVSENFIIKKKMKNFY